MRLLKYPMRSVLRRMMHSFSIIIFTFIVCLVISTSSYAPCYSTINSAYLFNSKLSFVQKFRIVSRTRGLRLYIALFRFCDSIQYTDNKRFSAADITASKYPNE